MSNIDHHDEERPQTPPVTETRTDRQRKRTHKAMLDAGLTLIAEQGLNRLTIAGITETADVGMGTFYNHFEDRAEYLRVLFTTNVQDWLTDLSDPSDARFPLEANRIATAAITLVRNARARPEWGAYVAEVLARPDVAVVDEFADVLIPSLERGIEQGCFTIHSSELGARFVLALARQALLHAHVQASSPDLGVTLAISVLCSLGTSAELVDTIVSGAATTAPTTTAPIADTRSH